MMKMPMKAPPRLVDVSPEKYKRLMKQARWIAAQGVMCSTLGIWMIWAGAQADSWIVQIAGITVFVANADLGFACCRILVSAWWINRKRG